MPASRIRSNVSDDGAPESPLSSWLTLGGLTLIRRASSA